MKKQSNKSLKKSLSYFKKYIPIFVVSFVFAIVGSIMTIIGPSKIKDLTNVITDGILLPAGIDIGLFIRTAVLLVILYAIGALASVIQSFITATVTQKMSKQLRSEIDVKINKLPLSYFDTNTVGDLLSRVTNDVDTLAQALGSNLANIVSSITLFVGVVIMMFVTNWILALVTIATSTLGVVASMSILKRSRKLFSARQKYMGVINGHVEETYSNYKVVKSYTANNKEQERFKKESDNIYNVTWKAQFLASSMGPIFSFVGDLAYVLIFVVGVSIIINGAVGVTLGTLMSFVIYAKLFSQPLRTLGQSMSSIQQAAAASERVFELLEQKELESEQDKTKALSKVKGDVDFNNINFAYVPGKTIINNFSASLKKGQKVAIVGPTGAGKTTIVNLLMRFYEVNSGSISIDGVNTKDITRENVHNLFDMILQDTWLFKGTVRENLVFNKQNVPEKELDKACKAVGLTSFIATLPNKYDTVIDGESSLSEGQKQQMTIARAIIRNAPLLILDEATSNIDTRTELAIQQAMDNLTKGRTSFVIAHRLSTIRDADVILVMDKGDIVEMGTHKELLAKNGLYANIYNSQFAKVS
ncbi:MAG: ABC transporter ATP-binding protein/permease [Clostridia bacterium]|nr:ABC transporter ATP-binding protein/permease [Clostridia bacterium]